MAVFLRQGSLAIVVFVLGLVLDPSPVHCQGENPPGNAGTEAPASPGSTEWEFARGLFQREASDSTDWSILPFVIYNPETSLAFGALYARVARSLNSSDRIRSSLTVHTQYTLKNQLVGGFNLETRPDRGTLVLADASLKLSWPDRLYPPGNRAGRETYEEWTARSFQARSRYLLETSDPRLLVGPMMDIRFTEIVETEDGGLLEQGAVEGAEDHGLLGLGLAATWDSRDSSVYPTSGTFHSFTLVGFRSLLGGTRWVLSGELDLRTYLSVSEKTIVALRGRSRWSGGDVPFTMHAVIGGVAGGLRGIYENRYAHRSAALVSAELRRRFRGRLGGVVFGGLGQVASDPWKLGVAHIHAAGGAGLRFALLPESTMNVGVDFAMGEGESNVYFVLGEVF